MFRMLIFIIILNFLTFCSSICPDGTIEGQLPNTCYIIASDPNDWFQAEIFCAQRGGHLTSISSAFENKFVHGIGEAGVQNAVDFWLGGTNNREFIPGYVGNWSWTDESSFTYWNWQTS